MFYVEIDFAIAKNLPSNQNDNRCDNSGQEDKTAENSQSNNATWKNHQVLKNRVFKARLKKVWNKRNKIVEES